MGTDWIWTLHPVSVCVFFFKYSAGGGGREASNTEGESESNSAGRTGDAEVVSEEDAAATGDDAGQHHEGRHAAAVTFPAVRRSALHERPDRHRQIGPSSRPPLARSSH